MSKMEVDFPRLLAVAAALWAMAGEVFADCPKVVSRSTQKTCCGKKVTLILRVPSCGGKMVTKTETIIVRKASSCCASSGRRSSAKSSSSSKSSSVRSSRKSNSAPRRSLFSEGIQRDLTPTNTTRQTGSERDAGRGGRERPAFSGDGGLNDAIMYREELQKVHQMQQAVLRKRNRLTKKEYRDAVDAVENSRQIVSDIAKNIPDFPFPNRMNDIFQVLSEIRYGMIQSPFSARGKSDAQLLREIQNAQMESLMRALAHGSSSEEARNQN